MQNELIPAQFVTEVLLNIKVSRAKLFLLRKNDMRGVGNTGKMPWVIGIHLMSQTDALTPLYTQTGHVYHKQTQYRKEKGEEDKGKKKGRSRESVCSSSAIRTLSLSVLIRFKLTIFSKVYLQRREAVIGISLTRWFSGQINRYSCTHTHTYTACISAQIAKESTSECTRERIVFQDRNEGRQNKFLQERKAAAVMLWTCLTGLSHLPLPPASVSLIALCEHLPSASNNKWTRAPSFIHHSIWTTQAVQNS